MSKWDKADELIVTSTRGVAQKQLAEAADLLAGAARSLAVWASEAETVSHGPARDHGLDISTLIGRARFTEKVAETGTTVERWARGLSEGDEFV